MKKQCVFLICLLLATIFLSGCLKNETVFQPKSYTADGTNIQAVQIDVRDRQIAVSVSEDDQIHIDYFESDKEFYSISMTAENTLTMTPGTNKSWSDYIGKNSADGKDTISLQIPKSLTSLSLSTTNEDIEVSDLTVTGSVTLSANNGNIRFKPLHVGKELQIDVKNGDIRGSLPGNYDDYAIQCKIKKGESNLPAQKSGGTKVLHVSGNNGDIDIQFIGQ